MSFPQIHKWREGRTDEGERPRTYDKFYQVSFIHDYCFVFQDIKCNCRFQKTPGNFQEPGTDSAVSVCSRLPDFYNISDI